MPGEKVFGKSFLQMVFLKCSMILIQSKLKSKYTSLVDHNLFNIDVKLKIR